MALSERGNGEGMSEDTQEVVDTEIGRGFAEAKSWLVKAAFFLDGIGCLKLI